MVFHYPCLLYPLWTEVLLVLFSLSSKEYTLSSYNQRVAQVLMKLSALVMTRGRGSWCFISPRCHYGTCPLHDKPCCWSSGICPICCLCFIHGFWKQPSAELRSTELLIYKGTWPDWNPVWIYQSRRWNKKISRQNATDIYIKGGNKAQIWHLKIMLPVKT